MERHVKTEEKENKLNQKVQNLNQRPTMCQEKTPSGSQTAIKSVAVIKKSQVQFPVSFRQLQSNTDLKTPPSNWLRNQVFNTNVTSKQCEFTSFIMGYQFPDCIGEVDIVSDAANIKKLLKIPYNPNMHMSMMVHRIEKTLFIDEFDVSSLILREHAEGSWKWLQRFFSEFVLKSLPNQNSVIIRPNKSRDVVRNKNLMSKFLHHSLIEKEPCPSPKEEEGSPVSFRTIPSKPTTDAAVVELAIEEHLPEATIQPFARNIIWNFEDLRMLIGTDLPIFGGGNYPCVSLKLNDMNKPISVLTGIDNWLDNLMCNVPEVMMCFHNDGIVQKYEMMKTEDIPHLKDCQFSPQLVRDIAQNILSFLKRKATKEGHTYWLFKGKNDEIVKLYDLTSLCKEGLYSMNEESDTKYNVDEDNPFTIPVAMLFYSVAKNLYNGDKASSNYSSIRTLLLNVLKLLDKDKYLKIHCQSNYMLSDIFLPSNIDLNDPQLPNDSEEYSLDDMEPEEPIPMKKKYDVPSIKVSSLTAPYVPKIGNKNPQNKPIRLSQDLCERCQISLKYAIEGLSLLHINRDKFPVATNIQEQSQIVDEPIMAQTLGTIPMPPIPSKDPVKREAPNVKAIAVSTTILTKDSLTSKFSESSWQVMMSFKYLRKVALIYMIEAKLEFDKERYGGCLRRTKLALHAWYGLRTLLNMDEQFPLPSQPLVIAGHSYYFLFKNWTSASNHIEQFNSRSRSQKVMAEILDRIIPGQECNWLIKPPVDEVDSLKRSYFCFESAYNVSLTDKDLKKKFACICNELGSLYMHQGQGFCSDLTMARLKEAETLWEESEAYLTKGLDIFVILKDKINIAHIFSNQGKLFRMRAVYNSKIESGIVYTSTIKNLYKQSFSNFESALDNLREKSSYTENLRESIKWDFNTCLITFAVDLQEDDKRGSQDKDDLYKFIVELYDRAIKLCASDKKSRKKNESRYLSLEYEIHLGLGSLNHDMYIYSTGTSQSNYKHWSEFYFKQACCNSLLMESNNKVLVSHLGFVKFIEETIRNTKSSAIQWKQYVSMMTIFYKCIPALAITFDASDLSANVLATFDKKVKSTLLEMIKLTKNDKSLKKHSDTCIKLYRLALDGTTSDNANAVHDALKRMKLHRLCL